MVVVERQNKDIMLRSH